MFASNDLFFYENDKRFEHSHIRILYWPTHLLHYTYNFLMNKFDTIECPCVEETSGELTTDRV
jgi:hypothetical protein